MPESLSPLTFEPIFKERVWGGRKLATLFGKAIPPEVRIGESWEIVDRADDQSIVRSGPLRGKTLHHLWTNHRADLFGKVEGAPRFPLLLKLLDCAATLSLQVHPPAEIAGRFGGEPKTECWYVAAADPDSILHLGVRPGTSRSQFEEAIRLGNVADLTHRVKTSPGDFYFIPSGRLHAIGGGNLIVEVQQNSDTTYRVFDWNRRDEDGKERELHIEQSLASIDFNDIDPSSRQPDNKTLVASEYFDVQEWDLTSPREITPVSSFAIGVALRHAVKIGESLFQPGEFFLVPAKSSNRMIEAVDGQATLLRITLPA